MAYLAVLERMKSNTACRMFRMFDPGYSGACSASWLGWATSLEHRDLFWLCRASGDLSRPCVKSCTEGFQRRRVFVRAEVYDIDSHRHL